MKGSGWFSQLPFLTIYSSLLLCSVGGAGYDLLLLGKSGATLSMWHRGDGAHGWLDGNPALELSQGEHIK